MLLRGLSSQQVSELEAYLRVEAQPETEIERKAVNNQRLKDRFAQMFKKNE